MKNPPIPPHKVMLILVLTLAVSVTSVVRCLAQEKIDQTRPLNEDGTVVVNNIAGSVSILGWNKKEVRVTGTLARSAEKLEIEGDKHSLTIKVVLPKRNKGEVEDTILEIRMPQRGNVDVTTVSADIEADEIRGKMELQSVSGDIAALGEPEELEVQTVSGTVKLTAMTDHVRAQSVSGDISVTKAEGDVAVETVSGDVMVQGRRFSRIAFNTVSGDLDLDGDLAEDGTYKFNSHSGDITLVLPAKLDADFDISTFSGDIDNDYGEKAERTGKFVPGKQLQFVLGSGDARVQINTFSGDVRLRKR
jgi:hypothetical protein